ncbi:MAG: hypothetical protein NTZ54_08925 [Alphaproteobacteria bacterium]|nr:hypothetical protein [Alphaproteobacteria bacterium]
MLKAIFDVFGWVLILVGIIATAMIGVTLWSQMNDGSIYHNYLWRLLLG